MLDISGIDFSWADKLKEIRLPESLSEELAEDIGFHIGDGSMYLTGPSKKSYIMRYSGNVTEDKEHYIKRIIPLKKLLFNVKINGKILNPNSRKNEFGIVLCSKAIYNFYSKVLKIPSGNKCKTVEIPEIILDSDEKNQCSFIRGLADADFSLTFKRKSAKHKMNYYPVISANFASRGLVKGMRILLEKIGFNVVTLNSLNKRYKKYYLSHIINLNGRTNLELWIELIGFNNPKHLTKYLIWKKFGFCPPHTTLLQRKEVLAENLDPLSLYKKERKKVDVGGGRFEFGSSHPQELLPTSSFYRTQPTKRTDVLL